jgi:hypothetical protein
MISGTSHKKNISGSILLLLTVTCWVLSDPTKPVAIILNNVALSLGVATNVINVIINVFEVHNPKKV